MMQLNLRPRLDLPWSPTPSLWKTPAIDQYDNAWLLWYLSADTDVTLLFNTEHDNLLTLLLRYFPQAWWPCSP